VVVRLPDDPPPVVVDTSLPNPPRRLVRGAERLGGLLGRRVLAGVAYCDASGTLLSSLQCCGRVVEVVDGVVVIERGDDEPLVLPADAAAFRPAAPGTYRLRGGGAEVHDPDYVTTWTVTPGQ
jgi:hypothetical protein